MKLKCPSCGQQAARVMTKQQLTEATRYGTTMAPPPPDLTAEAVKLLKSLVDTWVESKKTFLVCEECGYHAPY